MKLGWHDIWIFDCDGVLLDSNSVKTEAFAELGNAFGLGAAERLVAYHRERGGISRFEKINWFLREELGREPTSDELGEHVARFGTIVRRRLDLVPEAPGARDLVKRLTACGAQCHVVSGGLESEVIDTLTARGLDGYFTSILGSPRPKNQLLTRIVGDRSPHSAIYFGDSRYDHQVASEAGIEFVFVSAFTEFMAWRSYVLKHNLCWVHNLGDVVVDEP